MKNIIITGGLGFIGFNAVRLWHSMNPDLTLVIIDSETYAAQFMINEKKLWIAQNKNVFCYKADICNSEAIENIVNRHDIDTIVNFAAESHVDNSISNPMLFFNTNVFGTVNLLNIARNMRLRFHQISTDEVYGETFRGETEMNPADIPLKPSSPYSSSKASSDLIVMSYVRTFGVNATISRCTNNFGKWQHHEKLIPTVISKAMINLDIPIYGNGKNCRHWIHVDDHNTVVFNILEKAKTGEIFNIAPYEDNYVDNLTIVNHILKKMNKPDSLIKFVTDRPGHDVSYFLDGHMASERFGIAFSDWKSKLDETIDWYCHFSKFVL